MSDFDQGISTRTDEALEELLKHASPRPMPSRSDEAVVRQALRAEWQAVSGRHRSRRRIVGFAMAATVLIGVFSVFSLFRLPVVDAVQVATIEKSFGAIYLLGESSELRETPALSSVLSGQTIVTGDEAGIALAWGLGGSVRLDANTRVTFRDDESVYLESGRVYFDSEPSALIAGITAGDTKDFVVITDYGEVSHIGTQFMTRVGDRNLSVSVREGRVAVDGQYHDYVASSGEQVTLSGRQQPSVLSISGYAKDWSWVSRTSPPADVDGKSIYEFLQWVHRETGLEPRFEGQAEQVARIELLKGTIDAEPLKALPRWMATTALGYEINEGEGVIYVSNGR